MDAEEVLQLFSPVTGPHVEIFGWLGRIADISVMVGVLFEATENSRTAFAAELSRNATELLSNRRLFLGSGDQIAKAQAELRTHMRTAYERKVAEWPVVVLNMGLPMVCTVLEGYLSHVLQVCGEARPELIRGKSKVRVSSDMVAAAGSYEKALLAEDRRIFEFSNDIRANFKTLASYLDIETEGIFCMKAFSDYPQYKGWDIEKMVGIFKVRNAIIHRAEYTLAKLDDFLLYVNFFYHVMLNLAWLAADALGVPVDNKLVDVRAAAGLVRDACLRQD